MRKSCRYCHSNLFKIMTNQRKTTRPTTLHGAMDFLLSFRPFKRFHELEQQEKVTVERSYLSRSIFERFLLLSVDNAVWGYFQILGVFLRYIITTYSVTFLGIETRWKLYDYFDVVLDLFFAVDLISAILYRVYWPSNKRIPREDSSHLSKIVWRNACFKPRPIWMLIIDIISIVPFDIIRVWKNIPSVYHTIAHCTPALRIYKLPVYYGRDLERTSVRSFASIGIIFKFGVFWLLLSHSITCFWRWFAWYEKSELIELIKSAKSFNTTRPISWYWMLFYFVQIMIANIGFGDITATRDEERAFVAISAFVGFAVLNGYLISALSSVLARQARRVTILRFRISLIEYELDQRRVPKNVVSKIIKFYHSLWDSRRGVGPVNEMLISLPESLWGQVYFDIFKPALDASLLFRSCDEISKRALAKIMVINLFMAGDVILKRNEVISKMFYIRKGTVKIMSYQDDETQIMTFGAGSVFGQIALLLSLPAKSQVHAATFCEIHLIHRKDLFKVLCDYPKALEIVRNVHKNMVLNLFADKFNQGSSETDAPGNVIDKNSFYLVPEEASKVSKGDICLVNTCPYVFEPDTVYLHVWSVLLAVIITGICVYYPYCAAFTREYPVRQEPFILLIDVFLLANLYLSLTTAYVKENVLISSPRDILATKVTKFSTYVDIISLLPLHYGIKNDVREKPIILCLRCLHFYKIPFLFSKAESSVNVKMVSVLRLIKYVLYFFYGGYVMGMCYYLEACYIDPCKFDSWYAHLPDTVKTISPIWVSLYFAILVMSGTGYGDITANNEMDVGFAVACCLGGCVLFIYLIAEYSANLSLSREPRQSFTELADMVNSFLRTHKMLPSENLRVRQYLNLQWERNKGYEFTSNNSLFYDTPQHLLSEINQYTKSKAMQRLRVFKGMNDDVIRQILINSSRNVFPPHEVIIYAGDICTSLIVIEEGYCEVTYGKDVSQKKIITVGDDIGTVELLLGITSLCHVRTITHCSVLKAQKNALQRAFSDNPMAVKDLQELIAEFQKSPLIQEIKKKQPVRLHLMVRSSAKKSVYRFRFFRKQKGNKELREPYLKLGLCQWIRFFLGRMTILPYGKFLKIWELSRCFFAFCSAMIFPLLPYFELQIKPLYYIGYVLDTTAWVDLYFRLHVCYYNSKNLLVSHPLSTASHYLKGSFLLDFIFCFPFDRMMYRPVYDSQGLTLVTSTPINVLRLLRVGQVYRIPGTVVNLGVDFLSVPSLFRVMVMMIALTIVFLNFLTSAVVLLCVNYKSSKSGRYEIVIEPNVVEHIRSIQEQFYSSTEPLFLFLVNFYWICETSFGLGFGDITAGTKELMIYVIIVIIFSYLYFNYVTIIIASYLSSINVNLTIFQKRMIQLIRYLKSENVEHLLRKHIINHFEYVWKKSKGMEAQVVLANFNVTLRNDVTVYLYEDTLRGVKAFSEMHDSFFRLLSNDLDEVNFQLGAAIYKQGDIFSHIYIIQQGEVTMVGKDENDTTALGPCKIFGHLDNAPRGMAPNAAVATKNVTVLAIKTVDLYQLIRYAKWAGTETDEKEEIHFREALAASNTDNEEDHPKQKFDKPNTPTFIFLMYKLSKYILILYVILSLFSVNEVGYNLAFQSYSVGLICVLVLVELLFIFKIFIGFSTGYVDESGDFISSHRLIKARYLRLTGFYLDFFTVLPFEVFAWAFEEQDRTIAVAWFRTTKLLRMYNISYFFNQKLDALNVNLVLLKTVAVSAWTGTLLNQSTCLWILISCYRIDCPNSRTWKETLDGDFHNMYIDSLYFVVILITTTGFGDIVPHTILEMLVVNTLLFVAFFYTAIFIGQIISTTQKTDYAKTNFDFEVEGMKAYLHVNDVPKETQKTVLRYVKNLWKNENGTQIPELLRTAPSYLIHEIKVSTYGHHINQNPVFKTCNPFFKRQLIRGLYRTVYFAGDIIVNEGEVNRTVYFVHCGLVEGKPSNSELPTRTYEMNSYFGLKQGVRTREPHKMTYTALTYSVILSLHLSQWSFLTEFFPDDMKYVHTVMEQCDSQQNDTKKCE